MQYIDLQSEKSDYTQKDYQDCPVMQGQIGSKMINWPKIFKTISSKQPGFESTTQCLFLPTPLKRPETYQNMMYMPNRFVATGVFGPMHPQFVCAHPNDSGSKK